jgi:hypothetical protein
MTKAQLLKKIARLESIQDQLVAELQTLDVMLKAVGFENGLATMKAAATELASMLEKEEQNSDAA